MNKERAMEWADALESGEYVQGHGSLSREGKFCCLGVACELAIKNGVFVEKKIRPSARVLYDGNMSSAPSSVREYFGLKTAGNLSTANDHGKTFAEIAAFIRENWEKL